MHEDDRSGLFNAIMTFISVIYICWRETTYAGDRQRYANDLALACGWLVSLHSGQSTGKVIEAIVSAETTKRITDYWRSGEWGARASQAFVDLQAAARAPRSSQ